MDFPSLVRHAATQHETVSEAQRHSLASGQQPDALFITCSDSRVVPSLITGAGQGDLFELRTVGNIVPAYQPDRPTIEMVTVEYAVLQLGVGHVVVCGHSHCGAVNAMAVAGRGLEHMPALSTWLGSNSDASGTPPDPAVRAESQRNVATQLERLADYPFIRERVDDGRLRVHGWFYEIDSGQVWSGPNGEDGSFQPL